MEKLFVDVNGKVVLENAKLMAGSYRNFRGLGSDYNHVGDRNFNVRIDDPDVAASLMENGYRVKMRVNKETNELLHHFMLIKVNYGGFRAPRIVLHNGEKDPGKELTEDGIDQLDTADILYADIVINPYHWNRNGDSGTTAYLDTMHVVTQEDYFAGKYSGEE